MFLWKFHELVTGWVELIDRMGIDVAQPYVREAVWYNFYQTLFSIHQLLHAIFGLRGVFLTSNSLHNLGGQKGSLHAYVITQGICNRFIEVNFCVGCMVWLPNRLFQDWTSFGLLIRLAILKNSVFLRRPFWIFFSFLFFFASFHENQSQLMC